MKVLTTPFEFILNIIAFFDNLFRRPTLVHSQKYEEETFPIFENDGRETIREIMEHEPVAVETPAPAPTQLEPEILAPKGIALRKSVLFRTHRGDYRSAKVVGWDGDGALLLSRKGGPVFRRQLTS